MTLSKGFRLNSAPGPVDWRLIEQGLLIKTAANAPRPGILSNSLSPLTAQATMNVAVADQAVLAVSRGATDGVDILTNVGLALVAVTAPTANSWYASIYAKQNDGGTGGLGDPDSLPFFGVVYGAAGATPAIPAVPAGALKIGHVLIPAGSTSTQSAGVVVTNTALATTSVGGVVRYRSTAEMVADVVNLPANSIVEVVGGALYLATSAGVLQSLSAQASTVSSSAAGTITLSSSTTTLIASEAIAPVAYDRMILVSACAFMTTVGAAGADITIQTTVNGVTTSPRRVRNLSALSGNAFDYSFILPANQTATVGMYGKIVTSGQPATVNGAADLTWLQTTKTAA